MKVTVSFAENKSNPHELMLTNKLGESKSEVFHIKSTTGHEEYAIKLFKKDDLSHSRFVREKEIVSSLAHPNIIKNYPVVNHNMTSDILINEYAHHGDFLKLVTKGGLDHEVLIRTYLHQLVSGLEYLHSKGLAHLDLKLENLLLDKNFNMKITDFDQCRRNTEEEPNKRIGTECYRPLEILNKNCKNFFAADIFSVGVLLFTFKAQQFPFMEVKEDDETRIIGYDLFMTNNDEFWRQKTNKMKKNSKFFSCDFKKLLKGMLEKDPSKRFTIQDIKASEWYNKPILDGDHLKSHMLAVWKKLFENPQCVLEKKNFGAKLLKSLLFFTSMSNTSNANQSVKKSKIKPNPQYNAPIAC